MNNNRPKLFFKNEKGRYEEWHEPERPTYDNALYIRRGKRYEPVNMHIECHSWQEVEGASVYERCASIVAILMRFEDGKEV